MQSHDASGSGPQAMSVDDEGSLSDATIPEVASDAIPAADAAAGSADTQYFSLGSGGDYSRAPSEVSSGFDALSWSG